MVGTPWEAVCIFSGAQALVEVFPTLYPAHLHTQTDTHAHTQKQGSLEYLFYFHRESQRPNSVTATSFQPSGHHSINLPPSHVSRNATSLSLISNAYPTFWLHISHAYTLRLLIPLKSTLTVGTELNSYTQ